MSVSIALQGFKGIFLRKNVAILGYSSETKKPGTLNFKVPGLSGA